MRQAEAALILADADHEVRALVDDRTGARAAAAERRPHADARRPCSPNRRHHRSATWSTASSNSRTSAPRAEADAAASAAAARAPDGGGRACSNGKATPRATSPGSTGAPRGALVGRPLGGDGVGLLERQAAGRIVQRHPFVDVPLVIGDALDGEWSATGVPAFDPATGRFLGYRGLARRIDGAPPAARAAASRAKPTSMRCASWSTRSRPRSTRSSALPRSSTANISARRIAAIASARRRSSARRGNCSKRSRTSISPPSSAPTAAAAAAAAALPTSSRRSPRTSSSCLDEGWRAARSRYRGRAPALRLVARARRAPAAALAAVAVRTCRQGRAVPRRGHRRKSACALLTIVRPRSLDGSSEAQLVDPAFDPRDGQRGQPRSASASRCGWCAGWPRSRAATCASTLTA